MRNIINWMMAVALAAFSAQASAIAKTTVGTLDTLRGQTTLANSGTATEKAWVESVLGFSVTYSQITSSNSSFWQAVTGGNTGDYAFDFGIGANLTHYLVKVGGGKGTGTSNTHFLFDNLASLQYAYVNLSVFGPGVKLSNIGIVSHVGGASGGNNVPEPSLVGLLAIGLLSLAAARRRLPV